MTSPLTLPHGLLLEVQIFVPLHAPDGRRFSAHHHAALEERLARSFGGFTQTANGVDGGWFDGERLVRDRHRVYAVGVRPEQIDTVTSSVAAFVRAHYHQDAVYFRLTHWFGLVS